MQRLENTSNTKITFKTFNNFLLYQEQFVREMLETRKIYIRPSSSIDDS